MEGVVSCTIRVLQIYERFKVSKKVFKKAVGDLYKRRLIEITDHGLQLIN